LEIEPQPWRCAKGFGEYDSHLRGNAAPVSAYFVDACRIGLQMPGELGLRNASLIEHFLQDVAGMDGDGKIGSVFSHGFVLGQW
jgi:hypothetical protein